MRDKAPSLDHKVEFVVLKAVSDVEVPKLLGALLVEEVEPWPHDRPVSHNISGVFGVRSGTQKGPEASWHIL